MARSPIRAFSLTILQEQAVVDEHSHRQRSGEISDQVTLVQWAYRKFRLLRAPNQSTISRILRTANRRSLFPKGVNKRHRDGECKELELALHSWINAQFSARRFISGAMVKAAAVRIQTSMNNKLPAEKRIGLKFSNGWLQNFQRRRNLRSYKSHGESRDCDEAAISRDMNHIQNTIGSFKPCDVFNADEFGRLYRMAPDRTISEERLPGRKKDKTWLTCLAFSNADGTENITLLYIGHAERPRPFKKKYGHELGFDYYNNRKAWMTSSIFFAWLLRFSGYITRCNHERKVLLLMDNCSAHGSADSLPSLDNVEVLFLPPNTTSKLQPMDAGIIAAVKSRYRKVQYERALDLIDAGETNIYKVDHLTAMREMTKIWEELPAKLIKNCWIHTDLMRSDVVREQETRAEVIADVQLAVNQLLPSPMRSRVSLAAILNPEEEDDANETFDADTLGVSAADVLLGADNDKRTDDGDSMGSYLDELSYEERLRCTVIVKHMLEVSGSDEPLIRLSLSSLQRSLKLARSKNAKQTTIPFFFEKE